MIETPRPGKRDETRSLAPVSPVVSLIVGGESPQLRPVIAGPDGCPKCSRGVEAHRPCSAWNRQPPQRASWRVPAPLESLTRHGVRVIRLALCPLRRRLPLAADQRPRPPTLRVGSRAPEVPMCPHNPENRHEHTDSAGDAHGNVVPLRRRPGRAGVTVERIETEPMTADEYRLAVTALAALINQWKPEEENQYHSGENAA